jgi:hypothetical protein
MKEKGVTIGTLNQPMPEYDEVSNGNPLIYALLINLYYRMPIQMMKSMQPQQL